MLDHCVCPWCRPIRTRLAYELRTQAGEQPLTNSRNHIVNCPECRPFLIRLAEDLQKPAGENRICQVAHRVHELADAAADACTAPARTTPSKTKSSPRWHQPRQRIDWPRLLGRPLLQKYRPSSTTLAYDVGASSHRKQLCKQQGKQDTVCKRVPDRCGDPWCRPISARLAYALRKKATSSSANLCNHIVSCPWGWPSTRLANHLQHRAGETKLLHHVVHPIHALADDSPAASTAAATAYAANIADATQMTAPAWLISLCMFQLLLCILHVSIVLVDASAWSFLSNFELHDVALP